MSSGTPQPRPTPSREASSANSRPKPSAKVKTFQELVNSENKDDDDEQNFFAGGGRGSGLEVENPSDPQNLVQDLLRKAEAGQGHPDRMNEDSSSEPAKPKFTGTGYQLGSSEQPSRVVGQSSSNQRQRLEKANREITFWKDGFQVGDGKLFRYDDPANATYLAELNSGRAPLSLLNVEYGQDVDVNVIKKLDEEYKPPKRKIGGFHGTGQRLGSPVSTDYKPPSNTQQQQEPEPKTETEKPKDEGAGDTQVQIRLADGRRVVRRVESSGPVQQLYDYVASETSSSKPFILSHAFPVKPIEDKSQSIKEAGLVNSVVVQRWV